MLSIIEHCYDGDDGNHNNTLTLKSLHIEGCNVSQSMITSMIEAGINITHW